MAIFIGKQWPCIPANLDCVLGGKRQQRSDATAALGGAIKLKTIIRGYGIRMTTEEKQTTKAQAADLVRTRGTSRVPSMPRDLFAQAGPRGILLNWLPPSGFSSDIAGWRIYKDDETKLFAEIRDSAVTQHFIESTAGTTPPVVNLFVSSFNRAGVESPKVQIQGSALAEVGAPSMPATPPTYTTPYSGPSGGAIGRTGRFSA